MSKDENVVLVRVEEEVVELNRVDGVEVRGKPYFFNEGLYTSTGVKNTGTEEEFRGGDGDGFGCLDEGGVVKELESDAKWRRGFVFEVYKA